MRNCSEHWQLRAVLGVRLCFPTEHRKRGGSCLPVLGNQLASCEKVLALWLTKRDKKGTTKAWASPQRGLQVVLAHRGGNLF